MTQNVIGQALRLRPKVFGHLRLCPEVFINDLFKTSGPGPNEYCIDDLVTDVTVLVRGVYIVLYRVQRF